MSILTRFCEKFCFFCEIDQNQEFCCFCEYFVFRRKVRGLTTTAGGQFDCSFGCLNFSQFDGRQRRRRRRRRQQICLSPTTTTAAAATKLTLRRQTPGGGDHFARHFNLISPTSRETNSGAQIQSVYLIGSRRPSNKVAWRPPVGFILFNCLCSRWAAIGEY